MMRSKLTIMLAFLALGSAAVQAQEDQRFSLGLSSYATVIMVDTYQGTDDWGFGGAAINATFTFNNNVALRGHLYAQEYEDDENVELSGFDVQVLLGSNLAREGLKYYLALGIYSEELEADVTYVGYSYYGSYTYSEKYSRSMTGLIGGIGIGYNWERVALDASINLRQAQPYVDAFEDLGLYPSGGTVWAGSGALSLAYRF